MTTIVSTNPQIERSSTAHKQQGSQSSRPQSDRGELSNPEIAKMFRQRAESIRRSTQIIREHSAPSAREQSK
jgi:hypothetical protein